MNVDNEIDVVLVYEDIRALSHPDMPAKHAHCLQCFDVVMAGGYCYALNETTSSLTTHLE